MLFISVSTGPQQEPPPVSCLAGGTSRVAEGARRPAPEWQPVRAPLRISQQCRTKQCNPREGPLQKLNLTTFQVKKLKVQLVSGPNRPGSKSIISPCVHSLTLWHRSIFCRQYTKFSRVIFPRHFVPDLCRRHCGSYVNRGAELPQRFALWFQRISTLRPLKSAKFNVWQGNWHGHAADMTGT